MKLNFLIVIVFVLFVLSSCTPDPIDARGSQDSQAGDVRISARSTP